MTKQVRILMPVGLDARVGEMRGELRQGLDDEIRVRTDRSCPYCSDLLYRIDGYRERVMIIGFERTGLAEIQPIPEYLTILSCPHCRRNFTEPMP